MTEAKIRLSVDGTQKAAADVGRVGDSLKKLNADTVAAAGGSGRLADAIGRVAQYGIAGGGLYAAAQAVSAVSRALFDASAQAQRLATQLNFATSGNGARELAFVSQVANRLGLDLNSTAKAYAGFASAARGTSLEGQRARDVFESIAMASAVMGLSADESSGALLAVQQMMSKGVVSAEEFRGQLGERMPIALRAGAAALGVTEAAFSKMLETGQIVAAEFLPKFGDAIRREVGQAADEAAGRLDASVARMGNAWTRLKQVVGDSGISKALAGSAGLLANDMTAVSEAMDRAKASGAGFFGQVNAGLGQFIGRAVGLQLVNRDFLTMDQAVADATATIRRFDEQEKRDGKLSIYAMAARAEAARDLAKANRELAASGTANQGGGAGRGNVNPETIGETAARKAKDADALNALRLKLAKVPEGYAKDMQEVIRLNQLGVLVGKEYTDVLASMQGQLVKGAAAGAGANKDLAERIALMARLYAGPNGMQASVAVDLRRTEIAETDAVNAKLLADTMVAQAKATEAAAKARADLVKQLDASADSVAGQVQKLQAEQLAAALAAASNISLAEAIELVTIARLQEQRGVQLSFGDEDAAEAIQREIDKRRELAGLIAGKEARQAAADSAKDAAAEWKKTADSLNESLTDALYRAFESGKGFGRTLRDSLVNTFKTMVLRPIISAIVNPVAGFASGALGLSGAASAGTSAAGSAASSAAGSAAMSSLASMFPSLAAGASAFGNTLLAAGQSFIGMAGTAAQTSASLAAAGYGAGTASGGAIAAGSSAGLSVAAAIPYVAIAAVVANALGLFRSKTQTDSGLVGTLGSGNISDATVIRTGGTLFKGPDYRTNLTGVSASSQLLQDAFEGLRVTTAAQAAALGVSTTNIRSFTTAIGTDVINNDAGTKGLRLQGLTAEQAQAKIAEALQSANEQLAALALAGSNFGRNGESAVQTLARLSGSLSTVNGVLGVLGGRLYATSLAGGEMASKLADLFGGLSNFQSTTGAYFEAYFSEAERTAALTGQLSQQMRALGFSLPTTRAGFRQLVEAQDLTTDAGRRTYAALLQLSGAFALVVAESAASTAAADAAAAAAEKATAALSQRLALEERLLTAQGNTEELRRRELAALDPANRALQQLLYTIEDMAEVSAYSASVEAKQLALEERLLTIQGNTAELRARALAALDGPMNILTQKLIFAAEDAAAAAQIAAAEQATRLALEERIFAALGDTAELRARELAALGPANRALQQILYTMEDAAAAAAQAEKLRDAWRGVGESIADEVARIRGIDGATGTTLAGAQAAFVLATAQARAGDQGAAKTLPELSRALLGLTENNARTTQELAAARESVAASLEQTAIIARSIGGYASGGYHGGGLRIVGENGPELEATGPARIYSADQTARLLSGASGQGAMLDEMRAQRAATARLEAELQRVTAALQGMRAETQATAVSTNKSTRQLQEVIDRGVLVRTDADTPLATVVA